MRRHRRAVRDSDFTQVIPGGLIAEIDPAGRNSRPWRSGRNRRRHDRRLANRSGIAHALPVAVVASGLILRSPATYEIM